MAYEMRREDVDVILVRSNVLIFYRHGAKAFVPKGHRMDNSVRFGRRRHMFFPLARQLESEAHDAIHAPPREHRLLHRHLIVRPLVQPAADARILALIVFANNGEVDFTGLPVFQRRFDSLEKFDRAKTYILPEGAPDRNQQPPQGNVIRHAGMAYGAKENCVKRPQLRQTIIRHHLSGLHIPFAAPVKRTPLHPKIETTPRRFQYTNTFRNNFLSDAIAGNDRNVESSHLLRFSCGVESPDPGGFAAER